MAGGDVAGAAVGGGVAIRCGAAVVGGGGGAVVVEVLVVVDVEVVVSRIVVGGLVADALGSRSSTAPAWATSPACFDGSPPVNGASTIVTATSPPTSCPHHGQRRNTPHPDRAALPANSLIPAPVRRRYRSGFQRRVRLHNVPPYRPFGPQPPKAPCLP